MPRIAVASSLVTLTLSLWQQRAVSAASAVSVAPTRRLLVPPAAGPPVAGR